MKVQRSISSKKNQIDIFKSLGLKKFQRVDFVTFTRTNIRCVYVNGSFFHSENSLAEQFSSLERREE